MIVHTAVKLETTRKEIMKLFRALAAAAAVIAGLADPAAAQSVDPTLNESVQMITLPGTSTALETTIYRPDGTGPFPLAVISHSHHTGDPKDQDRFRPTTAVRYLLQRGYAVVVPMRRGFSKSGGWAVSRGCDFDGNAKKQAEDVAGVLEYVSTQGWADKSSVIAIGYSHGGLATLALGTLAVPGLKGTVNFAGGARNTECVSWQYHLAADAAELSKGNHVPSLWIYGDNDSFFGDVYRAMFDQYKAAGGNATLVSVGNFAADAHYLFVAEEGRNLWEPELTKFLRALGMPHEPAPQYARFGEVPAKAQLTRTNFAAVTDLGKVPNLGLSGRRGYRDFLDSAQPRAFAVGRDGAWGWASGENPVDRALDRCKKNSKGECGVYAVDDYVVWRD